MSVIAADYRLATVDDDILIERATAAATLLIRVLKQSFIIIFKSEAFIVNAIVVNLRVHPIESFIARCEFGAGLCIHVEYFI